jgi:hypothetical protein
MDRLGAAWRKSSYSGANGGNCTEVATVADTVLVRDSKNKDGVRLAFTTSTWAAFTARVKASLASPQPYL